MSYFMQDLRFALRTLRKSPVFTTVAILSLALGIGVNTALFSVVDRLLLRSLPLKDPEAVVLLDSERFMPGRHMNDQAFSYPGYKELRERNEVFTGVLARFASPVSLTSKNNTLMASAELISGNYFEVLGLTAEAGRLLTAEDDQTRGGNPVVVISHGYWTRRFGGDRSVIGSKILLNGYPFEIAGVAPRGFEGLMVGQEMEVFVPLSMKPQITPTWDGLDDRRTWFLNVFARLRPGVSREQAQTRLAPLQRQILEADLAALPGGDAGSRDRAMQAKLRVRPGDQGRSALRAPMRAPLFVLMFMVGLVLLIACANIANLLIARAANRQREIAIRLSIGASRLDLIRQLMTESAVLALAGGTLGMLVSVWVGEILLNFTTRTGADFGSPDWSAPDARILFVNFAVSILTAFLFGLIPAWKGTRPAVSSTLKDQSGSISSGIRDVRARKGLVIAQIALSLLLLFGATLFARSLYNLRNLDPGFIASNLITFGIDP
ncbi:MAG: ABC transporter permease, partial [Bryobacteraceae bacterium]|nr:ABC transporter permease [Bryobacteraceae bacterium]